ncbi:MAG: GNAT family N-acetyltransferase [Polyangiaceae bacterium]
MQRSRADNLLYVQSREYYEAVTPERGVYFAAWQGAGLVGFHLSGFASAIHPLWRPYMDRIGGADSEFCVNIQTLVHPDYRGRNTGSVLQQEALRHLRERGARHSLVTIHPDNVANLKICARLGYREIDRTLVYDTRVPRVLLHLDMRATPPCAREEMPQAHGKSGEVGSRGHQPAW